MVGPSAEDNNRRLRDTYLEAAKVWATKHASVFAPVKFAVQHFSVDKNIDLTIPLELEGVTITLGLSIRVLGIELDPRLIYLPHVRRVEATAAKRIGCLKAITGSTWGMSLADMR